MNIDRNPYPPEPDSFVSELLKFSALLFACFLFLAGLSAFFGGF